MELLQCGFLAAGRGQPASNDLRACTPRPVGSGGLCQPVPGGWGFALALDSRDEIFAWGVTAPVLLDQQGPGNDGASSAKPQRVAAGVVAAVAGFDHALLVGLAGELLALGPAHRRPQQPMPSGCPPPARVPLPVPVVVVAAGEHHSLALDRAGAVWGFGSNREGQVGEAGLGEAVAAPVLVLGPGCRHRDPALQQPVAAVAAGARHSVALSVRGQCIAWGCSVHGQCGAGACQPSVPCPTPVQALGALECTGVGAGLGHTVVCTEQGAVYAWGLNSHGQLGLGTGSDSLQPRRLDSPLLEGQEVSRVGCGARHSLALTRSGRALAWGQGCFGALGTGSFQDSLSPAAVAVPGGRRVVDAAAGWWHSLLLTQLSWSLEGRGLSGGWHGGK